MADYDVDKVLGRTKGLDLASLDDLMQVVEQVLETGKLQDRIEELQEENVNLHAVIEKKNRQLDEGLAEELKADRDKLKMESLTLRKSLETSREHAEYLQNQLEQAKMTNGENADYVARKVEVADELAKRNARLRDQVEHQRKAYKGLYGLYIEARDMLSEVRRTVETDEED